MSLLAALLLAATASAAILDRVAAVINGDVVTLSEVYELGNDFIESRASSPAARRDAELEVLESLILSRLISQEIERLSLDVSEVELDRTIDDIAGRNGLTREQLKREVERSGLPWSEYRAELKDDLRQIRFNQAIIQPRITVNDDELKDAYRRLLASVERPEIVELGAIFMAPPPSPPPGFDVNSLPPEDRETAREQLALLEQDHKAFQAKVAELQGRLAAGEDFATLAAAYDQGPDGEQGGRMGVYRQGELLAALNEPAFRLAVGASSGPVQTDQGVFILHVFDRYPEEPPPFEDVREQLMEQVYSDRIDEETDLWFQQTRRRSSVLIKLEDIEG